MPEPGTRNLTLEKVSSIRDIDATEWARLAGDQNPFLHYQFLLALEESRCTAPETGWAPSHLIFRQNGCIAGLIPAYLKNHSMGEYVFDWAWADAWQRHGLDYYPKLLMAIPFTPCQGPRLLFQESLRAELHGEQLASLLDDTMAQLGTHSWHLLFPDQRDRALLSHDQELHRLGCQFHWFNRDYQNFEDFLATLTSRKRKSIRKERRQVLEQGIHFRVYPGSELTHDQLRQFFTFYSATYLKRGQRPYLNPDFFRMVRERLPEKLHIIMAYQQEEPIAAALFLSGGDTLYGRYWGCLEEFAHLHFETCYYQGIELAIQLGLTRFDAGAQGEHKLVRGFEPVLTHSWHSIDQPGFRPAIEAFITDEAEQVAAYYDQATKLLPYRQSDTG
ncbi:MAG TPA: GNAT family N-acetyltransferase [Marinobacter sp.]|nr:GNAT family N-acetyltransferase [Marinobacter sp.]